MVGEYFGLYHDAESAVMATGPVFIESRHSFWNGTVPVLSQDCASFGEFSAAIDCLHTELEHLRREGRRHFDAGRKTVNP
jgi:hypothetical protein